MAVPNEVLEALDEMMALYYQRSKHDPDYDRGLYDIILEWQSSLPQAPQPDWSNVPEHYVWWCVDPDRWQVYQEEEPVVSEDDFGIRWNHGLDWDEWGRVDIPLGVDWRTLKQRRPETT